MEGGVQGRGSLRERARGAAYAERFHERVGAAQRASVPTCVEGASSPPSERPRAPRTSLMGKPSPHVVVARRAGVHDTYLDQKTLGPGSWNHSMSMTPSLSAIFDGLHVTSGCRCWLYGNHGRACSTSPVRPSLACDAGRVDDAWYVVLEQSDVVTDLLAGPMRCIAGWASEAEGDPRREGEGLLRISAAGVRDARRGNAHLRVLEHAAGVSCSACREAGRHPQVEGPLQLRQPRTRVDVEPGIAPGGGDAAASCSGRGPRALPG